MLGYRSDIEGFTGANWALNVHLKANSIDLFDGLSINPDEGLTRDDTAQMLYNAVQAQEVEYRNLDGNYNDVIYPTEKGTMLANRFGVVKVEGLVVANDVFGVPGYAATSNRRVRLEDTNTYNTTGNNGQTVQKNYNGVYSVDIPNDMVGTRIVIYVQFKNALAPNATDSTVIGTPISSDKNTVAVTANRMKDIDAVRSFLSDNDLSLTNKRTQAASSSDDGYYMGTLTFTKNKTVEGTSVERAFAATGSTKEQGIEFKFIDHDDDGVVDYIFRTEPTMAKVTVYDDSNKKMTIAGLGSTEFSDIANPEDVAKDDIVLYYIMNETYYLEKAETVAGKVESYNDNNKTVTIDGTSYGKSAIRAEISSTDLTNLAIATNEDGMDFVGNTYTFYLDSHGNVVAWVLGEESIGNYALVLGADAKSTSGFESATVKLLLADGSTGTYGVNLLASANKFGGLGASTTAQKEANMAAKFDSDNNLSNGNDGQGMDNTLVTYVIGADGKVTIGDPTINTNYSSVTDDVNGYTKPAAATYPVQRSTARYLFTNSDSTKNVSVSVNDSTLFFVRNMTAGSTPDSYTVVKGLSNLPTTKMTKGSGADTEVLGVVYSNTSANPNVAKAVLVDANYQGTAEYVYVTASYTGTLSVNGEEVYTYPVVFENGEAGTLNINSNSVADGEVYEYAVDNNGVADVSQPAPATGNSGVLNGYVTTYAKGSNLSVVAGNAAIPTGNFEGTLEVTDTLTLGGDIYVIGNIVVGDSVANAGNLVLNGKDMDGTGTVTVNGTLTLGSSISGSLTVNAYKAEIVANFTMAGGTLTIENGIASTGSFTLAVSGGTLAVEAGTVKANLTISGDADVTVGDVTGTVENNGTGDVTTGIVSGGTTGNMTIDVTRVLEEALAYEYDPAYTRNGQISVSGNTITYTGSHDVFTGKVGGADESQIMMTTADLARLMGTLWRFDEGKSVTSITYTGTEYTWDEGGSLTGSNWKNNGTTLMSDIASDIAAVFKDSDGANYQTGAVDASFTLTINGTDVTLNMHKDAQA